MRLTVPFDKPMKLGLSSIPVMALTKTTMAPSSARSSTELGAAFDALGGDTQGVTAQVHPDDPLLYRIPAGLHATYRPLPVLAQAGVVLLSMWISAISTWKNLTFLQPLTILRGLRPAASPGELFGFTAKTLLFSLILYMSLQEIFVPPSRVSTVDLCTKFHLPTAISKYEKVSFVDLNGATKKIGVHYLKYTGTKYTAAGLFGAVYVHHGFGASSLSWLPTLPSLVDRLGARFGLGHDMVGFGFTDRQEELEWYTTDASARISRSIFDKESCVNDNPIPSVVLLGHSLGAIGVLKMALQLPMGLSKVIILSSPALGLTGNFPREPGGDIVLGPSERLMLKISAFFQKYLVFPIGGYVLRRLVGLNNSWRFGLKFAAWGDPEALKDSDVLRYQWPAIGKGWERGLLKFASAQRQSDDIGLLREVLSLPNTTVGVIVGSQDRVIPPNLTRQFLANFQAGEVDLIQLEGLGHNAFEEDVDAFLDAIKNIIKPSE